MNKLNALVYVIGFFFCFSISATQLIAKKDDSKGEVIEFETKPYEAPQVIQPNSHKTHLFCKKYEGSYISYYQKVYRIQKCKRREVISASEISTLTKKNIRIRPVEAEVIRNIPAGENIQDLRPASDFSCKKIERSYITFSNVSVYFIENCKKRKFPDWTTYIQHSKGKPNQQKTIMAMPENAFFKLKSGLAFASTIDDEYSKQNASTSQKNIEIIPIDEACMGMNGRYFSYYSKIYKVEKCRKRLVLNSSSFVLKNKTITSKLKEISSTKWFSLPDGPPLESH